MALAEWPNIAGYWVMIVTAKSRYSVSVPDPGERRSSLGVYGHRLWCK